MDSNKIPNFLKHIYSLANKIKIEQFLKIFFFRTLIFLKKNLHTVIFINIVLIIISPWLFTRKWNIIDFTETGQIGDTLGGITSPFINVLNAILIFLAFKEQKDANDILRNQNKREEIKKNERLLDIKNLILYDLEHRIIPDAKKMIPEIKQTIKDIDNGSIKKNRDYIDFNDRIYKANDISDYNKIFNKDLEDLKDLIHIYNRVNFIFKHTPLQISYKYPTDIGNIVFINTPEKDRIEIISRNKEKKKIELEALIENINHLIRNVDFFIFKYK